MLHDADLVKVTQRMGISFAVDRHRVAVNNILSHVHRSLSGITHSLPKFLTWSASRSRSRNEQICRQKGG